MIQSYRLSKIESDSIRKMINQFEYRRYSIPSLENCTRFPEIYYGDWKVARNEFELNENEFFDDNRNPDYLGVYVSRKASPGKLGYDEGVIVLFKDRIERYCNHNLDRLEATRFVVLMHEIGHWLTHMAEYCGRERPLTKKSFWFNWQRGWGSHPNPSLIKETFAQLVAYWSCELLRSDGGAYTPSTTFKANCLKELENLTPGFGPYGAYVVLKNTDRKQIIDRLKCVQQMWMLKDTDLFELLQSACEKKSNQGIETFIRGKCISPMIDITQIESDDKESIDVYHKFWPSDVTKGYRLLAR